MLTLDLIEQVYPTSTWQRLVDDPLAIPRVPEEQLRQMLSQFMADFAPPSNLALFGYGSLLWHPEPGTSFVSLAKLDGWRRQFCLKQWAYRGTKSAPGLMLAIVPGDHCVGAAFSFDRPVDAETLWPVWRRELIGNGYLPAIVTVTAGDTKVDALTFLANPDSPRFASGLTRDTAADMIAQGVGPRGPSADYLCRTTLAFRGLGVEDPELEDLSRRVAARLANRRDQTR